MNSDYDPFDQLEDYNIIYSGLGSRETPADVLATMTAFAQYMAELGGILRSGAAPGADTAFEEGCKIARGKKEIILPWNGFNGRNVAPAFGYYVLDDARREEAERIAAHYHPAWDKCSPTARKLHTRNVPQILGLDLMTPTHFVVCWTSDGLASGGTGQALRIATDYKIEIYNLYWPDQLQELIRAFKGE